MTNDDKQWYIDRIQSARKLINEVRNEIMDDIDKGSAEGENALNLGEADNRLDEAVGQLVRALQAFGQLTPDK